MALEKQVVLLRGINVGGHNKVPMAQLKLALEKSGFKSVQTYIASGNIVLDSKTSTQETEAKITALIEDNFDCTISVIVRTTLAFQNCVEENPFVDAPIERNKVIHLGLTKQPFEKSAQKALMERAVKGEVIHVLNKCLFIDFGEGLRDTKLTPVFMEKCLGSPVTLRNLNTIFQLIKMSA